MAPSLRTVSIVQLIREGYKAYLEVLETAFGGDIDHET